jgi:hypothetical protein
VIDDFWQNSEDDGFRAGLNPSYVLGGLVCPSLLNRAV